MKMYRQVISRHSSKEWFLGGVILFRVMPSFAVFLMYLAIKILFRHAIYKFTKERTKREEKYLL